MKTLSATDTLVAAPEDGVNGVSYSIQCNADVIRKTTDGTFDPSTLTWVVVKSDGDTLTRLETLSACVAEGLTLKYMRNTDSSILTIQESMSHTILSAMTGISLYVYKAGVLVAEKTVKIVADGDNAIYDLIEAGVASITRLESSYSPGTFAVTGYKVNGASKVPYGAYAIFCYGIKNGVKTSLMWTGAPQNFTFNADKYFSSDYDTFLFEYRKTADPTSTLFGSTTVSVARQGVSGPSFYMAGTYSSTTSYTRDAFGAPVVQLDGLYYGQKKVGTITGINPKTDVANNGGNWEVFDMFKYIFTEVAFILFGKLGSAIFNGDFMFSQHGVNSSGVANQNYTAFNPSLADPTTNASFMPNILLNLFTGKAWLRDAVIGGSLTARALKRKVAHGGSGSYTSLTDCSGFYLDGDFSMPVLSEDTFMDLHGMVLQPEVRAIVATGTIFFPSSDNTVYYNGLVYSGVRYLKYQHSGGFIKVQFHGTSPSGYNNCWFIQVESSLEFTFTVELYT